jgi:hypothetical protein
MAIADQIETYSIQVLQTNYLDTTRVIRLSLASGGTAYIGFPAVRPANWLQFSGNSVTLSMTSADFDDVYRLLQTESPCFLTALDFFGLQVGAVHTELNLAEGEHTGEGEHDPDSLEALVVRARRAGVGA